MKTTTRPKTQRKVTCRECEALREVLKEGVQALREEAEAFDKRYKAEILKGNTSAERIAEGLFRTINNHNRIKWFESMLK
jgi:hypothetical protein